MNDNKFSCIVCKHEAGFLFSTWMAFFFIFFTIALMKFIQEYHYHFLKSFISLSLSRHGIKWKYFVFISIQVMTLLRQMSNVEKQYISYLKD